jgi:hypothetical protein
MKAFVPTAEHAKLKAGLEELMRVHPTMTKQETLAVASQIVGMLVALQDQRELTVPQAMMVVQQNLEIGNRIVIESMMKDAPGIPN